MNDNYATYVYGFMRDLRELDEASTMALRDLGEASPQYCLQAACTYAQAEAIKILVEDIGADIHATMPLFSETSRTKMVHNLIHEVLSNYIYRPDTDHTAEGREKLMASLKYLVEKGVPTAPNSHPFDNPIFEAAQLANPAAAFNERSPLCLATLFMEDDTTRLNPAFKAPYELFRRANPAATAAFEREYQKRSGLLGELKARLGFSKNVLR